jgi:hypothetical protein
MSFTGKSSGETYQLDFAGKDRIVIVQPFEERAPTE